MVVCIPMLCPPKARGAGAGGGGVPVGGFGKTAPGGVPVPVSGGKTAVGDPPPTARRSPLEEARAPFWGLLPESVVPEDSPDVLWTRSVRPVTAIAR